MSDRGPRGVLRSRTLLPRRLRWVKGVAFDDLGGLGDPFPGRLKEPQDMGGVPVHVGGRCVAVDLEEVQHVGCRSLGSR